MKRKPIVQIESNVEIDDIIYYIRKAIEMAQSATQLKKFLYGQRLTRKTILDLSSTSANLLEAKDKFTV